MLFLICMILSTLVEHTSFYNGSIYIPTFAMSELYQSAYKSCHSTETALVCVCDDIKLAFDKRMGTALIMIHLSAAFDTINHDILLRRLRDRYGIMGDALKWVKSYLTNRFQKISINEYTSCSSLLSSGVPQGSVLGPLLFSLYVQPAGDIIRKHGLSFHHYADDLQIYTSFEYDHHSFSTSLVKLQCCVSELQKWFSANYLIMNEDKTEFIPFVPKPYNHIVDKSTICIGDDVIRASFSVTDLGVVLDRHLKMSHQVSKMVQTCTYKLRLINVIRNKLTVTVAERVINAMVTGNLDYCNSLLNGITANEIGRIQKVQNTAARLILNRDRRSSATVMLNDLHWLSFKKRVMYKILLLVYKSLHGTNPDYITMRLN